MKLSNKTKFAIAGTILYIILPIDLIPDYLVGMGQVDDIAVIGYLMNCIMADLKAKKELSE